MEVGSGFRRAPGGVDGRTGRRGPAGDVRSHLAPPSRPLVEVLARSIERMPRVIVGQRPRRIWSYWIGDFAVGVRRVTRICSRSIISGILGPMFVFQCSLW